jgi:chitodextrinase
VVGDCSSGLYTPPPAYSGTDSFTYRVCDTSAACAQATVSYTITASSLHVGDLDYISSLGSRNRWNATVTVMVHDAYENPVANAFVEGSWSAGASGGSSCTTFDNGECTVTKSNIKGNVTSATFTINNITHTALNYKPTDNHDSDPDSEGTFIIVYKDSVPQNQPPQASFIYPCTDLTCDFDGSGSSDSDGTIVSYEWDFGDSNTGSGVAPSHTFAAEGSYLVELIVTDNDGATDSATQQVTLGSSGTQFLHVGDLVGRRDPGRRNRWEATVTIKIHADDESLFDGAAVTGIWSTGKVMTCTTSSSGSCMITLPNIKTAIASVNFTVTNLAAQGWEYNPIDNHETAITIYRP